MCCDALCAIVARACWQVELRFLKDAQLQIIKCRSVLKWTYVCVACVAAYLRVRKCRRSAQVHVSTRCTVGGATG